MQRQTVVKNARLRLSVTIPRLACFTICRRS